MANNLRHPLEDPPSSSPSSSAGEEEIESEEQDETPEDSPTRSGSKKRLSTTNVSSNVAKKIYTQGGKMGTNTRLFSEKDEIVMLQGIVDSKGMNPLGDQRSFYESVKGSFSFDVTLDQFKAKIWGLKRKYKSSEMRGVEASVLSPHEKKCFQLSKSIWGFEGGKMGTNTPSFARLFSDKDEIVLLKGIINSKGKHPLEDQRSFYQSMKGSFSFDVTLDQFKKKIWGLKRKYTKRKYTRDEMWGVEASVLSPHERKCFQLSKAIWGVEGIAFESADGNLKESEGRVSKKLDLGSSRDGTNAQEAIKIRDMKKSASLAEKESDWDESSFFLGMDFLEDKWTKLPQTETKKKTQEKMKKLHANELECQKFEEMLKTMKDKCEHDKVERLNEVTSLIMAAD